MTAFQHGVAAAADGVPVSGENASTRTSAPRARGKARTFARLPANVELKRKNPAKASKKWLRSGDSAVTEVVCARQIGAYLHQSGGFAGERAEGLEPGDDDVQVAADPLEPAPCEE